MPVRRFNFSDMDPDISESSSGSIGDAHYDQEDDQWQDAEDDQEILEIVSLFDSRKFPDVKSMLDYCKHSYNFDFLDIQSRLGNSTP